MRTVLPIWRPVINQSQISLLHQRRRLQGVTLPLFPEVTRGQQAKLLIDDRRQVLQRLLISVRPLGQEFSHIVGSGHGARHTPTSVVAAFYNAQRPFSPPQYALDKQ